MKLHDLRPAKGARSAARRVGRGHGSGRGKTAGRGTKGQKSRSGASIPAWFEGGQTPIHVRTPKLHGFRNRGRTEYAPINLGRLSEVPSGTLITPDVLVHDGVLGDARRPVKILGNGDAPRGVTIHAHAFSRAASEKLEAAGSTLQLIGWPDGEPIEPDEGEANGDDAKRSTRRTRRSRGSAANDVAADADEDGDATSQASSTQDAAPGDEEDVESEPTA